MQKLMKQAEARAEAERQASAASEREANGTVEEEVGEEDVAATAGDGQAVAQEARRRRRESQNDNKTGDNKTGSMGDNRAGNTSDNRTASRKASKTEGIHDPNTRRPTAVEDGNTGDATASHRRKGSDAVVRKASKSELVEDGHARMAVTKETAKSTRIKNKKDAGGAESVASPTGSDEKERKKTKRRSNQVAPE